ncbi:hypothetical protein [Terrabacter sp. NPDC080008]|uniref:hypothetical protein n=1 Tax=Terrabacter sp. NPDC080008 TaxID=3155176 RepID=UPI00344BF452
MSPPAPAQNRVTPLGEVVAAAGRGAWTGNRGRLHEGSGSREVRRHHVGRAWITCALAFRDRRVRQWDPAHYTPLFFLDEAVSLAAGHRPCAECRRPAYTAFRDVVARAADVEHLSAPELDRLLHDERWDGPRRTRRLHAYAWADLPDGAFVLLDDGPAVVAGARLVPWQPDNTYAVRPVPRPGTGRARIVTPPSVVAALLLGLPVQVGRPSPVGRAQARPSSSSEKA